jgi:hypothetical protein
MPPHKNKGKTVASDSSPKNELLRLHRATLASWLFWCALMGLLWGQIVTGTLHFRPLPFLILLTGLLVSTLLALGFGLRPLFRGTQRMLTLGWLIVALCPIVWLAVPCLVARQRQRDRQFVRDPAMHLAQAVGASLMEADIALRYSHRLETPHLVMFYDRLATPREDAEAMERHITQLETLLRRPLRSKLHWVRGTALGQERLSLYGLTFGSDRSYGGEPGRAQLDRHELAHAVIYQQAPWNATPPAFLIEGWAEWQGQGSEEVERQVRERREKGDTLPLATLVRPGKYYLHDGPAYIQGGAFVSFLLRRYGVEKFLRLYNTTGPRTFAADCRWIFGADLDTLEREFWRDLAPTKRSERKPRR